MKGATAVHRTAHVSAEKAGACAITTGSSCAVDLSSDYDLDGVATLSQPSQGDLDGKGSSYAADLLPAAGPTTLGGVTYQAPSTSGTDDNFVTADGQTVALPKGNYGRLQVLGTAVNGGTGIEGGRAVVTYADGSTSSALLRFTDWSSGEPEFGNDVAIAMPYRITAGQGKSSVALSLYRATVSLDAQKAVRSITLPGESVPEWVAPGLGGTAWDHDSSTEIYAMTLQGTPGGR
jgi:hypothetical protein